MPDVEVQPGIYCHFKGRFYLVFGIVPDASEPIENELLRPPLVVYQQLYAPFGYCYRPLANFIEEVHRQEFQYVGPRFVFRDAVPVHALFGKIGLVLLTLIRVRDSLRLGGH